MTGGDRNRIAGWRSVERGGSPAAFRDRADAGRVLARSLSRYVGEQGVIVLGLARGGVPVANQVARALHASLGVIVSCKIGVPGIEEVALGAIAEGSDAVVADAIARYIGVPSRIVERLAARERVELHRRTALYRAGLPMFDLRGRTVILVDDGLATGATLRAAIFTVRDKRPARLVAAVPVASRSSAEELRAEVDELVVVVTPATFDAVSASYGNYSEVSDEEVLTLLGRPTRRASPHVPDSSERIGAATPAAGRSPDYERTIRIRAHDVTIVADLGVPRHAPIDGGARPSGGVRGLAILAHCGGSIRNSYRNRYIAGRLRMSGYATLRLDLLTRDEQQADDDVASPRFDVERMVTRLSWVCEWVAREGIAGAHRTILIGASAGAAAALVTAARRPGRIFSVIARAGLVDLAGDALDHVDSPVLLIVGAADSESLRQNAAAMERLPRGAVLVRVPRAGQFFEEPGVLGVVAERIVGWLDRLERGPRQRDARQA